MRASISLRSPAPPMMVVCVLVDDDPLGPAELLHLGVFQLQAKLFRDHLTAGQHGNVLQHRLAAIAESRRLDCAALQRRRGSG